MTDLNPIVGGSEGGRGVADLIFPVKYCINPDAHFRLILQIHISETFMRIL